MRKEPSFYLLTVAVAVMFTSSYFLLGFSPTITTTTSLTTSNAARTTNQYPVKVDTPSIPCHNVEYGRDIEEFHVFVTVCAETGPNGYKQVKQVRSFSSFCTTKPNWIPPNQPFSFQAMVLIRSIYYTSTAFSRAHVHVTHNGNSVVLTHLIGTIKNLLTKNFIDPARIRITHSETTVPDNLRWES